MNAPDKIYVAESDKIVGHIEHRIFSESSFQRHSSIEYIRKDALLDWAKDELSHADANIETYPYEDAYRGHRERTAQGLSPKGR